MADINNSLGFTGNIINPLQDLQSVLTVGNLATLPIILFEEDNPDNNANLSFMELSITGSLGYASVTSTSIGSFINAGDSEASINFETGLVLKQGADQPVNIINRISTTAYTLIVPNAIDKIDNSYFIPISVNGQIADSTGNIIISSGGGDQDLQSVLDNGYEANYPHTAIKFDYSVSDDTQISFSTSESSATLSTIFSQRPSSIGIYGDHTDNPNFYGEVKIEAGIVEISQTGPQGKNILKIGNANTNQQTTYTLPKKDDGSFTIPISINGELADTAGNIELSISEDLQAVLDTGNISTTGFEIVDATGLFTGSDPDAYVGVNASTIAVIEAGYQLNLLPSALNINDRVDVNRVTTISVGEIAFRTSTGGIDIRTTNVNALGTVLEVPRLSASQTRTIVTSVNSIAADINGNVNTTTDLSAYQLLSQKNNINGYAGLDGSSKLTLTQFPTITDTYISSASTWNAKQAALVSGTNIKTVGGQTILGSGNLTEVQNSLASTTILAPSVDSVNIALGLKQNTLSGTGLVKSTASTITYITDNSTNWDSAYTNRITSLTTTGSSGVSTLTSNILNIPNYTIIGLGGVPTTRTLTINGTALDLSANRSWTVGDALLAGTQTFTGANSFSSLVTANGGLSITNNDTNGRYFGVGGSTTGAVFSAGYNSAFQAFGTATAATTGTKMAFSAEYGFSPTSGTASMSSFSSTVTINQTGGANGITRGLHINPTLTAAVDFRALDIQKGSIVLPYVAKTATYSIATSDYLIDCTSGTFTLTLPTAVGATGKVYIIKNSGSGAITIATTSSQTIDGVTTKTMNVQYSTFQLMSDGVNWKIISQF